MTRSRLWLGLAAALVLLFVAACGSPTAQPADPSPSATTTAAANQQAIEAAVRATLTAVAPTPAATLRASPTPTASPGATPVAATIASPDDVPRITAQELKARLDAGQAVVFDARRRESYTERHIAGAISLPVNEVAARLAELPADKQAVFYCT